jgi:hypothetical protein
VLAAAELLQACGKKILDPAQARFVGCFGAHRQPTGEGPHGPLAPVQTDRPLGLRAGYLPHLGRAVAAGLGGPPVAQAMAGRAHLARVAAQSRQVSGGVLGLDVSFGGQHSRFPSCRCW